MNGQLILRHQALCVRRRVDRLMRLYARLIGVYFVVAASLSLWLVCEGSLAAAMALFVLSTALTGQGYVILLTREEHIRATTDKTIDALARRWDEMRKDAELLRVFSTEDASNVGDQLDLITRTRVRAFVATFLDVYALVIYYINHGYFGEPERFALIYENMLNSLFHRPFLRDLWRAKDEWGPGCLREEYGQSLQDVVDGIIAELESEVSVLQPAAQQVER